jgi:hypothetical protein
MSILRVCNAAQPRALKQPLEAAGGGTAGRKRKNTQAQLRRELPQAPPRALLQPPPQRAQQGPQLHKQLQSVRAHVPCLHASLSTKWHMRGPCQGSAVLVRQGIAPTQSALDACL